MSEHDRQLDGWLEELAEADRRLDPPAEIAADVMTRVVIPSAQDRQRARRTRRDVWLGVGSAVAASLVLVLAKPWSRADSVPIDIPPSTVVEAPVAALPPLPHILTDDVVRVPEMAATRHVEPSRREVIRRTVRPPAERQVREVLDFTPLVPMSDEELQGAFQIVRVQLSRGPGGPVQADVLLGQDGMARAIRVSSR